MSLSTTALALPLPLLHTLAVLLWGALITASITKAFQSLSLLLATWWVAGQIIVIGATYFICSTLVSLGFSAVLYRVSITFIVVSLLGAITSLVISTALRKRAYEYLSRFSSREWISATAILLAGGAFSFIFFSNHLWDSSGAIATSSVYWDLNVHLPIIQSFALGDNFPAENDSLAGVPLTYHFFFDLYVAINARIGHGLVFGLNYTSVLALSMMFLASAGLVRELFGSYLASPLVLMLTITSGSLRYIFDLRLILERGFTYWLNQIADGHPYHLAFAPGSYAGYNGNMLNIFYFLAERQLILATTFLIVFLGVLYHRASFGGRSALLVGLGAGLFLKWHLFVTISAFLTLITAVFLSGYRRQSALILVGMGITCGIELTQLQAAAHSGFFSSLISTFPRFNPYFSTLGDASPQSTYPLTIFNFLRYYVFAFGFRLLLLPWASLALTRLNRGGVAVILFAVVPTLVCVNTLQLSPLSIYDNHKWLRPSAVLIDIFIAAFLAISIWGRKRFVFKLLTVLLLLLSSLGGVIELAPFLLTQRTPTRSKIYAHQDSSLTRMIADHTPARAIFLATNTLEVHLAGRRTFLSNSSDEPGATPIVSSFQINESERRKIQRRLYSITNRNDFCLLAKSAQVDYLEVSSKSGTPAVYSGLIEDLPISGANRFGERVGFIEVLTFCERGAQDISPPRAPLFPYTKRSDFNKHHPIYLSDLSPNRIEARFSAPRMDKAWAGGPMSLAGQRFERGVGLHAPATIEYRVPENASYFQTVLGLDEDVKLCAPHTIRVSIVDETGKILYESGLLSDPLESRYVYLDVRSSKFLIIRTEDAGDGLECDHVDLANALFLVPG